MAFIKEKFEDSNIERFMSEISDELLPLLSFMTDLELRSLRYELAEASSSRRSYKCYLFESPSPFQGYGQFAFQVVFHYQTKEIEVSHLSGVTNLSAAFDVQQIIEFLAKDFFVEFF